MPELPEVETVLRGLRPVMKGQCFAEVTLNRPDLRYPFPEKFVDRLKGSIVTNLTRRAKYLVFNLDSGESMIVHLGMSGRVQICTDEYIAKSHDHAVFQMSNGVTVSYNDPRRFGFIDLCSQLEFIRYKSFVNLGPEPLNNDFHANYLWKKASERKCPIKSFLLDQTVIAGLGNIYVCEALFQVGLDPRMETRSLTKNTCKKLIFSIQDVLEKAIFAGGSTLKDYQQVTGEIGYFQHQFQVYGREGEDCYRCQTIIQRITQSGRSTFYCPRCQKEYG